MNPIPCFSQSYAEARKKFFSAAGARGAQISQRVHPSERGAEGEELAMDLALLGNPRAPTLLLLTSATHGVEGFCGSGCQIALLQDDTFVAAVVRSGVEVLMLHALNPYGFSHVRRVNEDNADLNRNFMNFDAPLPSNFLVLQEIRPDLLRATGQPCALGCPECSKALTLQGSGRSSHHDATQLIRVAVARMLQM